MNGCFTILLHCNHANYFKKYKLSSGMSPHTFERHPVVFPFAPGCKFHLFVFLMNQEVFHCQGPRLPHSSLCAANHRVWWIGAAERAAAPLITLLCAVPTSLGLMIGGGKCKSLQSVEEPLFWKNITCSQEPTQAWLSSSFRKFSYTPPRPPSPPLPSPPPALLLPLSLPLKMLLSVAE